ncbi:MAG: BolA family protein [Halobacteria archaeon]|nr:BolA family protein [Halobacteria archaeon]
MNSQKVKEIIEDSIEDAQVEVVSQEHEDEKSEGEHFGLVVVSPAFEGENKVNRHRMVHKALGDSLGDEIHAVEIRAMTPDEA